MEINSISGLLASRAAVPVRGAVNEPDNPKLRELKQACSDFESMLTEQIMKEGLKAAKALNDDDENDNGCEAFKELANDQLARCVGKSALLGLGDHIYNSVKGRITMETEQNEL